MNNKKFKRILKSPEQREKERTEEKLNKARHLVAKLTKQKEKSLNESQINDIEDAIIKAILPSNASAYSVGYAGSRETTFCSLSYTTTDSVPKVNCVHGISTKRKGDIYNRRLGQILALIDCLDRR